MNRKWQSFCSSGREGRRGGDTARALGCGSSLGDGWRAPYSGEFCFFKTATANKAASINGRLENGRRCCSPVRGSKLAAVDSLLV